MSVAACVVLTPTHQVISFHTQNTQLLSSITHMSGDLSVADIDADTHSNTWHPPPGWQVCPEINQDCCGSIDCLTAYLTLVHFITNT